MSALNWGMGLIALVACGAALYLIIEQPVLLTSQTYPTLSMLVPPTLEVGQPFDVRVEATHHDGETITLTLDEKIYSHACKGDPCSFTIPLVVETEGDYTLFIQSEKQFAQLPIHVSLTQSVCLDGTREGACSTQTVSLRCVGQELIPSCSTCGCEEGLLCNDSACISPPYLFTVALDPPSAFFTTAAAPVEVTLTNTSSFPVTGFFVVNLDAFNANHELLKTFPQQVKLNAVAPAETYSLSISAQLPSATQTMSARLYHSTEENPQSVFVAESSSVNVSVQSDTSPPSPPTSLHFTSNEAGFVLSWNESPSADVSSYVIYHENLATGGFTTYSVLGETSQTSYTLPPSADGKAHTVKAKDLAGNESAAAQPIVLSAS